MKGMNASASPLESAVLPMLPMEKETMPLLDAIVEDGKLVLPAPLPYANGTKVSIQIEPVAPAVNGTPSPPEEESEEVDALEWLARNAIDTGIPDLADEHDHYIYGTPKRTE